MAKKSLWVGAAHYNGVLEAGRQGKTSRRGVSLLIYSFLAPDVEPVPPVELAPEERSTLADICFADMRRRKSGL